MGVVLLVYSGWLTLALPVLSFVCYCAIAGGMLLAWSFLPRLVLFVLHLVLVHVPCIFFQIARLLQPTAVVAATFKLRESQGASVGRKLKLAATLL